MTKNEIGFDVYFNTLSSLVFEQTGVNFTDEDSVFADYEAGKDVFVLADEIAKEYNCTD